jgi:hypothetical protein
MDKHSATISKDGEVNSITFDPKKFTPEKAKEWIREQGIEIIDFTEASPESGSKPTAAPKKVPAKRTRK